MTALQPCKVCAQVDPFDLIELDAIMADPLTWPATIWGAFSPPSARDLPASYRRFGAVEMAQQWLTERGFEIERRYVRQHYRYDVPKIATNVEDLIEHGVMTKTRGGTPAGPVRIDPTAYLSYYNAGIKVGITGLEMLEAKIAQLQNSDKEIPLALIKMAIDAGSKLATSQASIVAAGKRWGGEDDEDEAFRENTDGPLPSKRMGHSRVRVIDGEARPVADEGTADRERYSARAAQEGGVELPHR